MGSYSTMVPPPSVMSSAMIATRRGRGHGQGCGISLEDMDLLVVKTILDPRHCVHYERNNHDPERF